MAKAGGFWCRQEIQQGECSGGQRVARRATPAVRQCSMSGAPNRTLPPPIGLATCQQGSVQLARWVIGGRQLLRSHLIGSQAANCSRQTSSFGCLCAARVCKKHSHARVVVAALQACKGAPQAAVLEAAAAVLEGGSGSCPCPVDQVPLLRHSHMDLVQQFPNSSRLSTPSCRCSCQCSCRCQLGKCSAVQ